MWNVRSNNGLKAKISHLQPGYCTMCGKYSEHRNAFGVGVECLCMNKIGFQPNFIKINNILNYFDKSSNIYVPWNDYKEQFKLQNIDFELPKGFKFYPTFRTQDSEDWNCAGNAFEQSLIDEKITWFIYIKFYINSENKIKPLVVGKSGSLLVNSNGSDLNFSTNPEDGPARKFLYDIGLNWDKTRIAILKCNTELEALEKEKYYLDKLNLFGS